MERVTARLEEIYGERKWVIASQAAVSTSNLHKTLVEWGATTLVVASNPGTGDLPDTEILYTRSTSETIVGAIRAFFDSVVSPDPLIQAGVDKFDPEAVARVIAEPIATAQTMLSRRTFGVRRPEWSAWEDKMRVDQVWQALDITHAPYRIVDLMDAPAAGAEIGGPLGSVWVADNSQGWHGGGDSVRWVQGEASNIEMVEWFADKAERVRVMPFLDGLPCSIHGWVTATGVATFLPVEILTLRSKSGSELFYAGVSTLWKAPADIAREMRHIALKVGEELDRRDGYRGPYGIDGILTSDGFRPTELNPRMSAGAGVQLGRLDIPLGLVMRAEAEGLIEIDHKWLEEKALADREPYIHFAKMVEIEVRESFFVGHSKPGTVSEVESAADSFGEIIAGPSSTGSFVTGKFETDRIEQDRPVGHLIASILNLATKKWDLGLPELTAAPQAGGQ